MQNMTVGTDIIEVSRIHEAVKKTNFLARVFTSAEIEYYKNNGERAEILAGMFCAKEAAAKAVGTGIRGFSFCEIEVCHTQLGAPFLNFLGLAKPIFSDKTSSVSISHCSSYATAVCILYDNN